MVMIIRLSKAVKLAGTCSWLETLCGAIGYSLQLASGGVDSLKTPKGAEALPPPNDLQSTKVGFHGGSLLRTNGALADSGNPDAPPAYQQ